MNWQWQLPLVLVGLISLVSADVPIGLPTKTAKQLAKLPPCKLCTTLTESFRKVLIIILYPYKYKLILKN